jgi:hypothetical protein
MTRRQLILAGMVLSALVMSFFLRDVVERALILPLAYFWWLLGVYYSILPQFILWILLVALVAISAITTLTPRFETRARFQPPLLPPKGQIRETVEWLEKSQRGNYYKWLVANRLGRIAREILSQRDGRPASKIFGHLEGSGWDPPQKVEDYLESGLNKSFADYPRPRFWQTAKPTPLDADPKQVIEYLEDEMKDRP